MTDNPYAHLTESQRKKELLKLKEELDVIKKEKLRV